MEKHRTHKISFQCIIILFMTSCSPISSTSCSWRNPINRTEAANIALEEFKGTSRFFDHSNNKKYSRLSCPENCQIEIIVPTLIDRFLRNNDKKNYYAVSIVTSSTVIDKIYVSSCGIANRQRQILMAKVSCLISVFNYANFANSRAGSLVGKVGAQIGFDHRMKRRRRSSFIYLGVNLVHGTQMTRR